MSFKSKIRNSSRLKFMVTTFSDLEKPSGFSNNVYMDLEEMLNRGATVILSCKKYNPKYIRNGVEVILSKNDITLLIKTLWYLLNNSVDVIWINSNRIHYGLILAIFGRLCKKKLKIVYRAQDPVAYMYKLLYSHDLLKSFLGSLIAEVCESLVAKFSDIIIVIGNTMKRNFFHKNNRKLVLYNLGGVYNLISKERISNETFLKKRNKKNKYLTLGYMGVVQRHVRGLEFQIEVLKKYLEKYPKSPIKFLILGNGDQKYLAYFQGLIKNVNNIEIISGPISNEELKKLLDKIDVAIMEPLSIHLPSKFFEYILFGKIIIINKNSKDMISILKKSRYFFITINFNNINIFLKKIYKITKNLDDLQNIIEKNRKIGKKIVKRLINKNIITYSQIFSLLKY